MAIRTVNEELICTCENCGAEHFGGTLEFTAFVAELKQEGWRMKKDRYNDQWEHYCPRPKCQRAYHAAKAEECDLEEPT